MRICLLFTFISLIYLRQVVKRLEIKLKIDSQEKISGLSRQFFVIYIWFHNNYCIFKTRLFFLKKEFTIDTIRCSFFYQILH